MKHDFENAVRGAAVQATGKTRVTMYLDDDVIEFFREKATRNGRGYQTEINQELRNSMTHRAIVREDQSSISVKERLDEIHKQMEILTASIGRREAMQVMVGEHPLDTVVAHGYVEANPLAAAVHRGFHGYGGGQLVEVRVKESEKEGAKTSARKRFSGVKVHK